MLKNYGLTSVAMIQYIFHIIGIFTEVLHVWELGKLSLPSVVREVKGQMLLGT